jgi:hypothetical protein
MIFPFKELSVLSWEYPQLSSCPGIDSEGESSPVHHPKKVPVPKKSKKIAYSVAELRFVAEKTMVYGRYK